jgi:aquaporin Z
MNKYLVEFIGTFFLVFTIGNVVIAPGAGSLAPLAIGAALTAMVYAGGHISGAHYNPAITLAVFMRGKCDVKDVVPYLVAQAAAAIVAGLIVTFIKGQEAMAAIEAINLQAALPRALLVEILATFALAYVILNVATAKGTDGNSFYGLAIGFTVMAMIFAVRGVSGGVFNPAVAVGTSVMGLSNWTDIWVYFVANFGGAALAAIVFKVVNGDE